MSLSKISQAKVFGGLHQQYQHQAKTVNSMMKFAIFLPPNTSDRNRVPVLYWLSGLTCNEENFMFKAGAFELAAQLGMAIVTPDTSPRGDGVADDKNGDYDLGLGAGFYINATQAPWKKHYQMYDYVTDELPKLIEGHFPVSSKKSIAGHSMGGHGALIVGLKNQNDYQSISAFSPIVNPSNAPWGIKAFTNYLGNDQRTWEAYDSCELMKKGCKLPILIDQGDGDQFLKEQLNPGRLEKLANEVKAKFTLRSQKGYDHSYFFISTFIDDHLNFHHKYLFS